MTRINDYLWHLPHTDDPADPPDVAMLQQMFNAPIAAALIDPLAEFGYELKSSDVMVRLESQYDMVDDNAELQNTYIANVRFIAYLKPDVITRVHFEHGEWAHFLHTKDQHVFYINLDRFKVQDPRTQIAVPAWHGRLHSRMSNDPSMGLHHNGEDQIWTYTSGAELEEHLALFLDKFQRLGQDWLSDPRTM